MSSPVHRRAAIVILVACAAIGLLAPGRLAAQGAGLHGPLGEILDLYVRDGQVYYRALQMERGKLDRYVASLDVSATTYEGWSKPDQIAFWVNAYNAFVLRTVIDHYPIKGVASEYPSTSIRQIPGAFDRLEHRAAGRNVTLDAIEATVLAAFGDPRAFLVLGRGAVGSPRLRSEALTGARLDDQLAASVEEFASRARLIDIDEVANLIRVTPLVSWREAEFAAALGDPPAGTTDRYATRSAIERAVLHLIEPHLLPMERSMVERNDFTLTFGAFDWRLNDLTGGRID